MSKKQAHVIIFIFDLLCLWGLWFGYQNYLETLGLIASLPESLTFGNRDGFFIVGIGLPIIHILTMIEYFKPKLIYKYKRFMNIFAILFAVILLSAGFAGSSWLKSRVENAGYFYCNKVSEIGVIARTLVYTKNANICEEIIISKKSAELNSKLKGPNPCYTNSVKPIVAPLTIKRTVRSPTCEL